MCGGEKRLVWYRYTLFMHGQFSQDFSVSTRHCSVHELRPEMSTDYRCLKVVMISELANR